MKNTWMGSVGASFILVLACGCSGALEEDGAPGTETVGTAVAELSQVPTGITCVRLILSGSTSSTKTFAVTAGTTPVKLNLGNLPVGSVTIAPSAFNLACASVTAMSTPTWLGNSTTANIVPGVTTNIALTLAANQTVSATVDFLQTAVCKLR